MSSVPPPDHRTLAFLAGVPVDLLKGIGATLMKRFEDAGVASVADLLLRAPMRYVDRSQSTSIGTAPVGDPVTVTGTISRFSKRRISRGRVMVQAQLTDDTGFITLVWFNPYLSLADGEEVSVFGTIEHYRGKLQMKAPAVDRLGAERFQETGRIVPVYPTVKGIKPAAYHGAIANALRRSLPINDILPERLLDEFDLVDRSFAVSALHEPESLGDVGAARRRLTFDEFLWIQMAMRVRSHDEYETQRGVANSIRGPLYERYLDALPFEFTDDQRSALDDILADMGEATPLHRLLQGEVGSGKTVVVVAALLTSVESGHQAAFMAPTEVLATQHYLGTVRSLTEARMAPSVLPDLATGTASLFEGESLATRPVRVGLFTSSRVQVNFRSEPVSRSRGLEWLADGTIDIAFGTHALIQPDIAFRSLGITVVDEQHRFGVEQRVSLRDRDSDGGVPDLLLMTATPIPRTFVMALYGDLEVSTIETMPPGRAPIRTAAVAIDDRTADAVDEMVRSAAAEGRQAFVVCPLVDDSDKIDATSATAEFSRLARSVPEVTVGLLHGQLPSEEKADVMDRFRSGEIDVLVATTVIEVGIDVPNATLMVIWDADRFGLSQLHQLRGRVGRGSHGGTCVLLSRDPTPDGQRRTEAMVETNDGFELARVDLEIRGHGTLFGASQSGVADLRFGDLLRDADLIALAATCARDAVATDRHGSLVEGVVEEFDCFVRRGAEWLAKS